MPTIPGLFRREDHRDDLLGCFYFYVSPPAGQQPSTSSDKEDSAWTLLQESQGQFERQLMEHLVERLDIPVKVNVFFRRGSLEIAALVLGAYTVLKDYKTLRDSLSTLRNDVVRPFVAEDLGLQNWDVEATVWTPGSRDEEVLVGGARMDLGSRYAFLYLMVTNLLLILFLGFLILLPIVTESPPYP